MLSPYTKAASALESASYPCFIKNNCGHMPEQFRLLVVEDNDDDSALLHQAIVDSGLEIAATFLRDAWELEDYLTSQVKRHAPLPSVVLLDLNLPKRNGLEVLRWIKAHRQLGSLLVVIWSGSLDPEDEAASYEHGASLFIVKPVRFAQFDSVLRMICDLAVQPWTIAHGAQKMRESLLQSGTRTL